MIALPVPGTDTRVLTGRDQLLGQQVPQPVGAFHRPGPLRPGRCPGQQPLCLRGRGPDPHLAQRGLIRIDRHRRVRSLVRVHADHHHRHDLPLSSHSRQKGTAADMSYYGSVIVAPLTSHTHHPGHPGRWRVAGLRQRQRGLGLGSAAPAERHGSHRCRGRRAAGAAGHLAAGRPPGCPAGKNRRLMV